MARLSPVQSFPPRFADDRCAPPQATPGALQAALAAFKDSTFLLESLIWKIADLRRMDGIKQAHFKALLADLARSHA